MQAGALQLINSGRYEQRQDFAVVIQTFFRNTLLPLDSVSPVLLSHYARASILISLKPVRSMPQGQCFLPFAQSSCTVW